MVECLELFFMLRCKCTWFTQSQVRDTNILIQFKPVYLFIYNISYVDIILIYVKFMNWKGVHPMFILSSRRSERREEARREDVQSEDAPGRDGDSDVPRGGSKARPRQAQEDRVALPF